MKKIFLIFIFLFYFSITSFAENNEIKEIKTYDNYSNIGNIVSSFDGNSMSFSAKKKGGFIIVKDGKEIGNEYYEILNYSYSDNSIYYIANKSYKGEYILLKDGKEILSIDGKSKKLHTSKKGGKYAITIYKNGKYDFLINGKLFSGYDEISNMFISTDGKQYGFEYKGGININGINISGNYKKVYGLTFSPNGNHYSYIVKKNNGTRVVVRDGIEGKEYKDIYNLYYSNDGNNIAYVAEIDYNKSLVVLNNQELNINSKLVSDFSNFTFSESNDLFFTIGAILYKNDKKYLKLKSTSIKGIYISANGNNIAYQYGDNNIFVDGKTFKSKSKINDFIFSPNNKDYAFTANKGISDGFFGASLTSIIRNGEKITGYDKTYSPLFLKDGTFAFIGEVNDIKDSNKYKRYLVFNGKIIDLITGGVAHIYSVNGKDVIFYTDTLLYGSFLGFYNNNKNDFLSFTKDFANPETVNKDPKVIGVNGILAFLYLIVFYFIFQLFGFYSDNLLNSDKIDNKINNITNRVMSYIFNIFYNIGGKINKKYTNKIREILLKYEHKIYVILGLFLLGVIGQIGVSTFNIYSINGWIIIMIMLFILGIIIFLKNILLYIYTKKDSKDNLKIENSPIGYILAIIILNIGNYFGMIPNLILSNTINLKTKTNIAYRKISKPSLLLNISYILFFIGIILWSITKFFTETSFIYKFLISIYFLIINDLFFVLLPFSAFWGFYILKDKKQKIKWFMLIFIVGFSLFHTILNPNINGDFDDLLKFKGNFKILVYLLGFLTIITSFLYLIDFYFRKQKISKSI